MIFSTKKALSLALVGLAAFTMSSCTDDASNPLYEQYEQGDQITLTSSNGSDFFKIESKTDKWLSMGFFGDTKGYKITIEVKGISIFYYVNCKLTLEHTANVLKPDGEYIKITTQITIPVDGNGNGKANEEVSFNYVNMADFVVNIVDATGSLTRY